MNRSQSKFPLAVRITAAAVIVLWLAAVSACNLEFLFCCDSHGQETIGQDGLVQNSRDEGAHHSHEAEDHSNGAKTDSHSSPGHDGKEHTCCSTLKAVVQMSKSLLIAKLVLQPIAVASAPGQDHPETIPATERSTNRQTKWRDRVLTPEVCTGPANRSHAPPLFI